MKTSDFDYELPQELIAQTPIEPRDHSRLLVYDRADRSVRHLHFYDLPQFLHAGDALVINETKVIPARLLGQKEDTGVPVELLLLKRLERDVWEALVRPGRRLRPGTMCVFGEGLLQGGNHRQCRGRWAQGALPLSGRVRGDSGPAGPDAAARPTSMRSSMDKTRYQTVYAREEGSALPRLRQACISRRSCWNSVRRMGVDVVPMRAACGAGHLPSRENGGPSAEHHMHVGAL